MAAGIEAPPPRSVLVAVSADEAGEVVQGPGGQRNRDAPMDVKGQREMLVSA